MYRNCGPAAWLLLLLLLLRQRMAGGALETKLEARQPARSERTRQSTAPDIKKKKSPRPITTPRQDVRLCSAEGLRGLQVPC
ncbi:hypothetical protein IWX46DRAFT_84820 [Phyllosticta citricarpa]|uniref:Uncharacterized protein n=1 Tax=Phyllosticta citricarpa TaxID=55181 RepID=A0ABR1MEA8_9PEZI